MVVLFTYILRRNNLAKMVNPFGWYHDAQDDSSIKAAESLGVLAEELVYLQVTSLFVLAKQDVDKNKYIPIIQLRISLKNKKKSVVGQILVR